MNINQIIRNTKYIIYLSYKNMRQQKRVMSRSPSSDHESNQLIQKIINGNMNSLKAIALGQIERENLQYSPQNSKAKQIDQYNNVGLPEQALNVNRMHLEKRAKKMIKVAPQQNTQGTGIDILNTFDDITADLGLQSQQQVVRPDTIEYNVAQQQFDPLHQYPFNTKFIFPNLQNRQPNINIRDDDIMNGTLRRDHQPYQTRNKSNMSRIQGKQYSSTKPESLSNINDFIVQSNIRLVEKKTGEEKAEVQMKIDLNQPEAPESTRFPNIGVKSDLGSVTEQASQFNKKQTSLPPPQLSREAPPKSAVSKMSNFKYQRNSGMNHTTNGFTSIRPKLINLNENNINNNPGSMKSKYPEGDDDSPVPDPHNSGARIVNIKHTSPETNRQTGDQSTQQKYRPVWIDKKEHLRLLMRSPANNKDLQFKYRLQDPTSELQNEPEMSVMGSQGLTEYPMSMPQSNFDFKEIKSSNIKIINDAIIKNGQFKSLSNRYGYMGGLNGVQGYTGHGKFARKGSQIEQNFQSSISPSKQTPGKNLFSIQPDVFSSKRFSQIQQLSPSNKLLSTIGINEHQLSGRIKAMKTSQQDLQEKEVDKNADQNEQSFSNRIIQERISPIHVRRLKENIDRNKKIEEEEGETDFLDQLEKSVEFKGKIKIPSEKVFSPTSTTYGNMKTKSKYAQKPTLAQAAFNQMQYSFYSSKTARKMSHGGTVSASQHNQQYLVNKDLTDSAFDARQLNVDSALSRMSDGFTGRKLTHQQLQQMLMKTPQNPGLGFRSINSSLDSSKISNNIKQRQLKKMVQKPKDINNFSFKLSQDGQQKSNGILKNQTNYNIDAILRHSALSNQKNADKVNNHFENIDQAKLVMYDQIKPIINQQSKQNHLRDSQKKIDLVKYENDLLKHDHVRRSSQEAKGLGLKKNFEEIQNQLNEQSEDGNSPKILVSKEVSAAQFPDFDGPRGAQTSYQSIKTQSRMNTKADFGDVASLAKEGRAVQSLLTIHNQSSPSKSSKKVIKLQVHDQMKNPQTKRIFDTYKGTVIKSEGKSENSGFDHDSSVAENFKKRNSGGDINDMLSNQSENKIDDTPIGHKEAKLPGSQYRVQQRSYELRLDNDRESLNHGSYQYQQSPETSLNLQGKNFTQFKQKESPMRKFNRQQNKDLTQNYKQFQTIQGNSPTSTSIKMPKNVKISFRHQSDLTKKKSPVETKKDKAKIKKENSSKAFLRINNIDLTPLAGQTGSSKQQGTSNWLRYKEEKAIAQRQMYEEQLRSTFNNSTQFLRKLNRENSSYAQNSSNVRLPDDINQKLRANNISLNTSQQDAVPSAHLFRKHSRNSGLQFPPYKTLQMTQDQMHELAQKKINSDINSLTNEYEQFQSQKKAQNKTHQAGFYRQHKPGKTVVLNNTVTNALGMPKITIQNEDQQSSGSRTNHMFLQNGQNDSRPVTEERDHIGGGSKMQMSPNYHEVVNQFPQAQLQTDQTIMTDIMPQIFSNQMIQGVKNQTRSNSAEKEKMQNEFPTPTAKLVTELQESLANNRNNTRMFEIQQKINQLSMMTNMNPQHLENQILPLLLQNQKQHKGIFVPKPQLPKQLKVRKSKKRSPEKKAAAPEEDKDKQKSVKAKVEPMDMIHMRNRRHTMATKPKEATRQIAATHAFTKKNHHQYKTDVIYNNDMSHLQI